MPIRIADLNDLNFLKQHDKHISEAELMNAIKQEHILISEENGETIGWLRYNLFWDNTPFMNMLFILSEYRGKNYGENLVLHWEEQLKRLGFNTVMTSTQANECAQHFYSCGGFNTPTLASYKGY